MDLTTPCSWRSMMNINFIIEEEVKNLPQVQSLAIHAGRFDLFITDELAG